MENNLLGVNMEEGFQRSRSHPDFKFYFRSDISDVIYQTRGRVFHHISKHREDSRKYDPRCLDM